MLLSNQARVFLVADIQEFALTVFTAQSKAGTSRNNHSLPIDE